jgi:hypothetical protein
MLQNAISQKARIEAATAAMNALDKMKEKGQITPAKHEKKRKAIADTDWTKGMSDPIADVNGRPEDYGLGKKTGNMVDDITALGAAGVKSYKHDGMEVQFGEKDDEILDYGELYGVVIAAAEKYYKDNTTPAKALYELTEAEKQSMFLNGTWKQAAGILLYEFANNSGPGARTLFDRHSYTKALKASSAVNQMTESFISAYNDDQQYNNSCNDAGTTFSFSEKYNFSPEMEYAGLELGWLGFLVGTVFKTSFRALDSLLKHIRTAVSLNDEILITRGGMKFEFNYAEGSPTVQIVISDGYSLASLGGHILSSRIRNSSDVFGNTDIFIQMSIPTPTRLKVRP